MMEFQRILLLDELKWMFDNGYITIAELHDMMKQMYNLKKDTMEVKIDRNEMVRELAELYTNRKLTLDDFLERMVLLFCDLVDKERKKHGNS